MHPLVMPSQNMDYVHNMTEIAVEVGGEDALRFLWSEWDQQHQSKFQWVDDCRGKVQYYGDISGEGQQLLVKCNFLKINNCVLMLLQPHGRFVDFSQLKKQAQIWLGKDDKSAITDTKSFQHNRINSLITVEANETELSNNEASFPYGAKSAVIIEDDYTLDKFIEHTTASFAKRQISCTLLSQFNVKEYPPEIDKQPMQALLRTIRINGFAVTFFGNSGFCGDRLSLQENAKQWFPNALKFVTQENIADLFAILEDASIRTQA